MAAALALASRRAAAKASPTEMKREVINESMKLTAIAAGQ
jgi:hypothetical protein